MESGWRQSCPKFLRTLRLLSVLALAWIQGSSQGQVVTQVHSGQTYHRSLSTQEKSVALSFQSPVDANDVVVARQLHRESRKQDRTLLSEDSSSQNSLPSQNGTAAVPEDEDDDQKTWIAGLCGGIGGLLLLFGCGWYIWVNREQEHDEYKVRVDEKIAELRETLRMTRKDGFVLSSEHRVYLHSHIVIERRSMEAVAQFFLLEGFDVRQFDSFSSFLLMMQQDEWFERPHSGTQQQDAPQRDRYSTLVSMVLETCEELLLPHTAALEASMVSLWNPKRNRALSMTSIASASVGSMEGTWQQSAQHLGTMMRRESNLAHLGTPPRVGQAPSARFAFLEGWVKELELWRDLDGKNFAALQAVAQALMQDLQRRCDERALSLRSEPLGPALASLVWHPDAPPAPVSAFLQHQATEPAETAASAEGSLRGGEVAAAQLDVSVASAHSGASTHAPACTPAVLPLSVQAECSAPAYPSSHTGGGWWGGSECPRAWSSWAKRRQSLQMSGLQNSVRNFLTKANMPPLSTATSQPDEVAGAGGSRTPEGRRRAVRQDDEEVRAIRMDEEGRQEYMLQLHRQRCTKQLLSLHRGPSSAYNAALVGAIAMMEEVSLAQLHSRACLLNAEFQRKVEEVVRGHRHPDFKASSRHASEHDAVAAPSALHAPQPAESRRQSADQDLSFPKGQQDAGGDPPPVEAAQSWVCAFEHGAWGEKGAGRPVLVHPAPVKTKQRMRAKLRQYADSGEEIPFSANILDPVRTSIVCSSPADLLEVYGWFVNHEEETGLRICRVKNKFLLEDASEFDGYRDLMLCVFFRGESGLGIIGEIQLHDRELFELKKKMHKLYKVKRAKKAHDI